MSDFLARWAPGIPATMASAASTPVGELRKADEVRKGVILQVITLRPARWLPLQKTPNGT